VEVAWGEGDKRPEEKIQPTSELKGSQLFWKIQNSYLCSLLTEGERIKDVKERGYGVRKKEVKGGWGFTQDSA